MYLYDLGRTPVYFGGDEAHFAVVGHSLATTGRNLEGDLLPVFVNLGDPLSRETQSWGETFYQPLLFYVTALVLEVLPLTESVVRAPVALIAGVLSPLLIYAVARRLIGSGPAAVVAAAILASAPLNVLLGRQALDYVLPIPFVLAWLWCLHAYQTTGRPRAAAWAGFALGMGCYSYIASWMMMPLYLAISWVAFFQAPGAIRAALYSAAGFALCMVPFILWVPFHPEMIRDTFTRYGSEERVSGLFETYFSLFDPMLLFVRGGPTATASTSRTGVFLVAVSVLFAAGLFALWQRSRPAWVKWVLIAGLLSAPVPAAIKGEAGMIQRALYLLPFVALIGAMGFAYLWESRVRAVRVMTILLLASMPVQFAEFYYDYFTHYKFRSAFYYDPVAFVGVADYLMRDQRAPHFYFTLDLDDACVKWRLYTTKRGRTELLERTTFVDVGQVPSAEPESLLVTYMDAQALEPLGANGWDVETIIHDVDNRQAAAILRKMR